MTSASASKTRSSSDFTMVNELLTESSEKKLEPATVQKLIPQDGGREAWCFLAAEAVTQQLTWGFTTTFGVFREFYFKETGSPFAGVQVVAEIGVMATGLIQGLSPFILRYLTGRRAHRKPMMWIGMSLCCLSSIGAGFARTPVQLIMTQGVLYGIGSSMLFSPSVSLIEEWFVKRRSLAFGLYFGASSAAAAVFPPVMSHLLDKYGRRTTLIGWGVFSGTLISCALLYIQPRPQTQHVQKTTSKVLSYRFLIQPLFLLFVLSNILQAFAQFFPTVYIPSYAADIGASATNGALLLTYYNLANIFIQPTLGWLADTSGVPLPLLLTTILSTLSVLVVWGFSFRYWTLVIVVIVFGGLSGGFNVLRPQFATAVVGRHDYEQELLVSGVLMSLRGAATIVSGFVGAIVVGETSDMPASIGAYGLVKWRALILMVGILTAASSVGALGFVGGKKRVEEATESQEKELEA